MHLNSNLILSTAHSNLTFDSPVPSPSPSPIQLGGNILKKFNPISILSFIVSKREDSRLYALSAKIYQQITLIGIKTFKRMGFQMNELEIKEQDQRRVTILYLPLDIWMQNVYSFLSLKDFIALSLTNHQFYSMTQQNPFFQNARLKYIIKHNYFSPLGGYPKGIANRNWLHHLSSRRNQNYIRKISLQDSYLNMYTLQQVISHCPNLNYLKLNGELLNQSIITSWRHNDFFPFLIELQDFLNPQALSIVENLKIIMSYLRSQKLQALFASCMHLQNLELIVGDPQHIQACRTLKKLNHLQLEIAEKHLSQEGIAYLSQLTQVTSLTLKAISYSFSFRDAVFATSSLTNLKQLNLINYWSKDNDYQMVLWISKLTHLNSLYFENCQLSPAIINKIKNFSHLKIFIHSFN